MRLEGLRNRLREIEVQCTKLRQEIVRAENAERIVEEHRAAWTDVRATAPDKIVRFLRANPAYTFTAAEILRATWTNEDAGRKALTRLYAAKAIRRAAWGKYGVPA